MIQFIASPALSGSITARDILNNQGSFTVVIDHIALNEGGVLFQINDDTTNNNFVFSLSIQNKSIVFQRNDIVSVLTLDGTPFCKRYIITVTWSYNELSIYCSYGNKATDSRRATVKTKPTTPPNSLIKWARKNNLIPVEEFNSEEEFRNKVHSCLISIQEKINDSGSFLQFWNILYEGQRIVGRTPKKEVEVQPIIHCLLSDQFLMSSIEIIPEYNSAVGNLDFLFMSNIKNAGIAYFCVEFKNAHSDKLVNGLLEQLPCYMENKKSRYGAYCVLNYRGEYFDKPKIKDDLDLITYLEWKRIGHQNPYTDNTRIFTYNLSKPKSASRR